MADGIKLRSPEEVKAQVLRIAAVLKRYEEGLQEDAQLYNALGQKLEEAAQALVRQQRELQITLEQLDKIPEKSEAARRTERYVEARLNDCYDRTRQINHCYTEYESICQDLSNALKESSQLADNGQTLSTKIGQLLTKIMDSM